LPSTAPLFEGRDTRQFKDGSEILNYWRALLVQAPTPEQAPELLQAGMHKRQLQVVCHPRENAVCTILGIGSFIAQWKRVE